MLSALLVHETRRRIFDESIPRIEKCLDHLTEEEVWERANANTNSVGVLILHLCGNARQWIYAALGGAADQRRRDEEFAPPTHLSKAELRQQLHRLIEELTPVLDRIRPAELVGEYQVQVFKETGVSILVHAIEHFSYHTGQISHIVKASKNVDLGYYGDLNL